MKIKQLMGKSLLALAGAAIFLTTSAQAQTYTSDDLFIGFRAHAGTGSTTPLLLNIGQASIYRDASGTISIGNIGADLANTFGAGWATRSDLWWGVAGAANVATGLDPLRTLYASSGSPFARQGNATQGTPTSRIGVDLAGNYVNFGVAGVNTAVKIGDTADANDWAELVTNGNPAQSFSGNSFGYFAGGIEENFSGGVAGTSLEMYRALRTGLTDFENPTAGTPGVTPAVFQGSLFISGTGDVSFGAIPEPSTYASLAFGGLLLFLVVRRHRNALQA